MKFKSIVFLVAVGFVVVLLGLVKFFELFLDAITFEAF